MNKMHRSRARSNWRIAIVVSLLAATGAAADTEIHRCALEDGTIAFQETPCPEPAVDVDDDTPAADNDDFVNPFDEPANPPTPAEPTPPEPLTQDRAECEKTSRDAIDAIDLEMRTNTYTKEQGLEYRTELLALTKQLRTCKQL
ncbi:MAG: hypothetical protein OEW73_05105 [Gammaproteobacteria bacterium]|nr:hypothetical protein [Gammaproteobacteria bacterium]MDH5621031.1 hypothetical protein [Gammaproteobacteria bacterium]